MRKLILIFSFLFISTSLFSQVRFVENFDYPAGGPGDSLGAFGWNGFSSGLNIIKTYSPGLTYAGYPYSGIGNAVKLDTTGEDAFKFFPSLIDSTNSSAAYMSLLINVSTAKPYGAYVAAMIDTTAFGGAPQNFRGRLYVKDSLGNVRFGVAKSAAADTLLNVWSPINYLYNTTYLIVLKYKYVSGPNNDEVSLFVFSAGVPAVEPVTPTLGPLVFPSVDANTIKRALLRQGEINRGPRVIIDGIRIANVWQGPWMNMKIGVQGLADAGTSRIDTVQFLLRNNTSPYAVIDSRVQSANFNNGIATEPIEFVNAGAGNYYFEFIYRNLPAYRNGINSYSKAGGSPFVNATTYSFTSAASQVLGSNQILVGSNYCTYNADPSGDQYIDVSDMVSVYNDQGFTGYSNNDITGDDFVDVSDMIIVYNSQGIGEIAP